MIKIKNLGVRIFNDKKGSWCLYFCEYCEQYVEKRMGSERYKSCGCMKNKFETSKNNYKHGGCGTRLYRIWINIKNRCYDLNSKSYKDYGGRGIVVCNEWLEFIPFRDWSLSNGYSDNLEIDRIKNNLGYNPENCQWVTHKENCNNRRPKNKKFNLTI